MPFNCIIQGKVYAAGGAKAKRNMGRKVLWVIYEVWTIAYTCFECVHCIFVGSYVLIIILFKHIKYMHLNMFTGDVEEHMEVLYESTSG